LERKRLNNPLQRHSPQAPLRVAVLIAAGNKKLFCALSDH
jgi:hypothetical protein